MKRALVVVDRSADGGMWTRLPSAVISTAFAFLARRECHVVERVCRQWRSASSSVGAPHGPGFSRLRIYPIRNKTPHQGYPDWAQMSDRHIGLVESLRIIPPCGEDVPTNCPSASDFDTFSARSQGLRELSVCTVNVAAKALLLHTRLSSLTVRLHPSQDHDDMAAMACRKAPSLRHMTLTTHWLVRTVRLGAYPLLTSLVAQGVRIEPTREWNSVLLKRLSTSVYNPHMMQILSCATGLRSLTTQVHDNSGELYAIGQLPHLTRLDISSLAFAVEIELPSMPSLQQLFLSSSDVVSPGYRISSALPQLRQLVVGSVVILSPATWNSPLLVRVSVKPRGRFLPDLACVLRHSPLLRSVTAPSLGPRLMSSVCAVTGLKYLNTVMHVTRESSFSALSQLACLESLVLRQGRMYRENVLTISHLTSLNRLMVHCDTHADVSLSSLSTLTRLTQLTVPVSTPTSDLTPLTALTCLHNITLLYSGHCTPERLHAPITTAWSAVLAWMPSIRRVGYQMCRNRRHDLKSLPRIVCQCDDGSDATYYPQRTIRCLVCSNRHRALTP